MKADLDLRKTFFQQIVLAGGSTMFPGAFPCWQQSHVLRRNAALPDNAHAPHALPVVHVAGFGERLLNEVRGLAPRDVKIRISAPPERKYSTWIGGCVRIVVAALV